MTSQLKDQFHAIFHKGTAPADVQHLPKTYKAAFFESKGGSLVLRDVELKLPGPGQVLVKTLACGVCHSDSIVQAQAMSAEPRVPGHEIVGEVVAVGDATPGWKIGERVGGPWHGGHDGTCTSCRRGLFQMCEHQAINGVTLDGGYAEYVLLHAEALVRVPAALDPAEAAPLLCAGVTVFNAMRKQGVASGALVAVLGLGGLGHLAVQYASRMGFRTVALSRGGDKRDFARRLGAHEYIDTAKGDAAQQLQALGGAALVVATAPNPEAIAPLINGLEPLGKLLVLAPCGDIAVPTLPVILKALSVVGYPSGHALDSEEAIQFAQVHGVKCMVERFSLADAQKAYDHMMSNKARFRAVITF